MHYVLIDYENVQPDIAHLVDDFNVDVTVFLGVKQRINRQTKESVWLMDTRAEIIKMTTSGPNALDFHLAFHLGQLVMGDPVGTFEVISNDKGYDSLILRLADRGINVRRTPGLPRLGARPPRVMAEMGSREAARKVGLNQVLPRQVLPLRQVEPHLAGERRASSPRSGSEIAPSQAAAHFAADESPADQVIPYGLARSALGAKTRLDQGLPLQGAAKASGAAHTASEHGAHGKRRGEVLSSGPEDGRDAQGGLIGVSVVDIVYALELDPAGLEARHLRAAGEHQSATSRGATSQGQPPRRAGQAAPAARTRSASASRAQPTTAHRPDRHTPQADTIDAQGTRTTGGCQQGAGAPRGVNENCATSATSASRSSQLSAGHNKARIRALRKSLNNLQRKIEKLSCALSLNKSDTACRRKLDRARQRQRKLNHLLSCAEAAAASNANTTQPSGRRILRVPPSRR